MAIGLGDRVIVRTAEGTLVPRVAVSGIIQGAWFPVVLVCKAEDWPDANGDRSKSVPWPADAVELATESNGHGGRKKAP